jgi:cytochrome c oxidase cbb3-type subunit I/II
MLIFPSWGGMINGLLTLRGAWDRVRDDVILKFFVVAVTAYGMATFEGPMLSLKNVNAVAHFTDWIIAHVHVGALGWNGMLTFGVIYWLIPRISKPNCIQNWPAFLAGHTGYFVLRYSGVLGWFHPKLHVETIY